MDHFDRQRYISIYQLLAEILERERPRDPESRHLSYVLGDLARRIFVSSDYLPPDDLLEEAARAIRSGDERQVEGMARRLREHAQHLAELEQ